MTFKPLAIFAVLLLAMAGPARTAAAVAPSPAVVSVPSASYSVPLAWNPSRTPNVTYKLYYGPATGFYTNSVATTTTSATVTGLDSNAIGYWFAVVAVDAQGQESDFSNEVTDFAPTLPNVIVTFTWTITVTNDFGIAARYFRLQESPDLRTWRMAPAIQTFTKTNF